MLHLTSYLNQMKYSILFIISVFSIFFISCNKCKDLACETPPLFMRMKIINKQHSTDLLFDKTFNLDSINVFLQRMLKKNC